MLLAASRGGRLEFICCVGGGNGRWRLIFYVVGDSGRWRTGGLYAPLAATQVRGSGWWRMIFYGVGDIESGSFLTIHLATFNEKESESQRDNQEVSQLCFHSIWNIDQEQPGYEDAQFDDVERV
nr:hypothetical protein Iba_chr04fCG15090 [Ipomoea batatas]